MNLNDIIYADLSTYTPEKTMAFYEAVFGWKYYEANGYFVAYKDEKQVVGLYETPEKFKQMRMPHFWMTYVQVENVEYLVEKAKNLGAIIEMAYAEKSLGSVALIRDSQGAGFTIYAGDAIENTRTVNEANTLVWNELHVSDASTIIPFYQNLFGWKIKKFSEGYYPIFNNGNHISDIYEIPNQEKGKYEYWVSVFAVANLENTKNRIVELGGTIVFDEGNRILCTDNSEQAFFYVKSL
ncbi:MAG: VOC family protein [Bacteroidota bacterium]